jgi:hypothetical protein
MCPFWQYSRSLDVREPKINIGRLLAVKFLLSVKKQRRRELKSELYEYLRVEILQEKLVKLRMQEYRHVQQDCLEIVKNGGDDLEDKVKKI